MITKGFISEVSKYQKIDLGETEEFFLSNIQYESQSASDVLLIVNQNRRKPMAYKNAHKRIRRLHSLGLIQELKGTFKHGAIKYELTSRGLFQLLLTKGLAPHVLNLHKDNIILEIILYQFFEVETIKKFITIPRFIALRNFLRECCEAILKKLEELEDPRNFLPAKVDKKIVMDEIDEVIRSKASNFFLEIIMPSKIRDGRHIYDFNKPQWQKERWFDTDADEDKNGPNYSELFPRLALTKDKKFMKFLNEIKISFDKGCKDYF